MANMNENMSLKDKIHFAISDIEDEKFLESIYTILEDKNKKSGEIMEPNEKLLEELNLRRAKYLSGEEKALSIDEFKAKFFENHGV